MLAVEMKKSKEPAGLPMVGDFLEKTRTFAWPRPDNIVLPSFFPWEDLRMRPWRFAGNMTS